MSRFTLANTPLLAPTVALMAGIIITEQSADNTPTLYLLTIGLPTLSILTKYSLRHRIQQPSWRQTITWCFLFLLGSGLTLAHHTDNTAATTHNGQRLTFLARIDGIPQQKGHWQRVESTLFCYADTVKSDHSNKSDPNRQDIEIQWIPTPSGTKVRLYADTTSKKCTKLQIGDIVQFRGRIHATQSDSYDLYMRRTRGITANCFTWNVTPIDSDTTFLNARIELLRHRLAHKLKAPDPETTTTDTTATQNRKNAATIMQALAIGDQSDIDPNLRHAYSRTGVAHLLSVSGLHVGIIFMILNLLFGWIRLFHRGPILVGIIVILTLSGYALLTGLSPSVIRAVLMFSLLQIGLMLSRYTNSFNTLCAAALLLLVYNPYYLYHIGFQLSFAAMVGIITLYQPIARLWMPRNPIGRWLWSLTLVGITAQIGTFPLVMYHFGQLQLAGILLNPIIWFTVPVIIGGSLLYLASGWEWLYVITSQTTDLQNNIIEWMASHPWVAITGIKISWWICAAISTIIIILIILINRQSNKKSRSYFLRSLDAQVLTQADARPADIRAPK